MIGEYVDSVPSLHLMLLPRESCFIGYEVACAGIQESKS